MKTSAPATDHRSNVATAALALWQDIREEVIGRVADAILQEMQLSSPMAQQRAAREIVREELKAS